nr:AGC protein kinase [Cryptococcus depauperatus CBS 7841]
MATVIYNSPRPTFFTSTFHATTNPQNPRLHLSADPIHRASVVSGNQVMPDMTVTVEEHVEDGAANGSLPHAHAVDGIVKPSTFISNNESPTRSRRHPSVSETSMSNQYVAKLEDFELIRVLGKGCAGRVLLVKHTPMEGIHAMKAISKRSVLTHDELGHTLTEVSILRRFATQEPHNRFVSKLHYSFTDRENFYFVMEFYPGGDLATQMEIYGILGDHRTRFYAADITQGLEDLHRHGIIVRDLKPENILLNAKGHAVLADFGLSKEFPYRGEPKPVHVFTSPDQPGLPTWAGKGIGSYRMTGVGGGKLNIDKAYSFVGTSEYLSPEVVKRGEYSYAVDWWALGCIVLEGLIGRVPFRKAEDDPPMVLWNKILYEPWDDCFRDPKLARFAPDPVTYNFIDALLEKDPMRRITEPCVKQHDYFSMIDWPTVQRGEYQDPHGLHIHPTAEYNTRYFPKLCLEEEPSVDMSTHDVREYGSGGKRTPMNDSALYKLECARYRKEIESFTWSRKEWDEASENESVSRTESIIEESIADEGESHVVDETAGYEESAFMPSLLSAKTPPVIKAPVYLDKTPLARPFTIPPENTPVPLATQLPAVMSNGPLSDAEQVPGTSKDSSSLTSLKLSTHVSDAVVRLSSSLTQLESIEKEEVIESPTMDTVLKEVEPLQEQNRYMDLKVSNSTELLVTDISVGVDEDFTTPRLPAKPLPSIPTEAKDTILPLIPAPPASSYKSNAMSIPAQPVPIPDTLRNIPQLHLTPTLLYNPNLKLPTDLPHSGLSASDVISIPSMPAGHATPRLLRRHLRRESEETVPLARLSVELHGTVTQLDDEGWEELGVDKEGIPTAPNGIATNSSFFKNFASSALRRKPSTLVSSSLRKQYGRDSDASSYGSSASPTKSEGRKSQRKLFASSKKGVESTKRALKGLKVFPRLKAISPEGNDKPTLTPLANPPTSFRIKPFNVKTSEESLEKKLKGEINVFYVSGSARRHTESGWFERHLKRSKPSSTITQHDNQAELNADTKIEEETQKKTQVSVVEGQGLAPRLELKESEPVVWGF